MTGITTTGKKRLILITGRAHPDLAEEVAAELGVELVPGVGYDFANGEIYVRFGETCGAATPSCCRATARRSTSGSWSSCSCATRSSAPR